MEFYHGYASLVALSRALADAVQRTSGQFDPDSADVVIDAFSDGEDRFTVEVTGIESGGFPDGKTRFGVPGATFTEETTFRIEYSSDDGRYLGAMVIVAKSDVKKEGDYLGQE